MAPRVTRRDLLNVVVISVGTGLLTPTELFAQDALKAPASSSSSARDPPTLTGMRGSHEGSYEVAHALAWRGEKPA